MRGRACVSWRGTVEFPGVVRAYRRCCCVYLFFLQPICAALPRSALLGGRTPRTRRLYPGGCMQDDARAEMRATLCCCSESIIKKDSNLKAIEYPAANNASQCEENGLSVEIMTQGEGRVQPCLQSLSCWAAPCLSEPCPGVLRDEGPGCAREAGALRLAKSAHQCLRQLFPSNFRWLSIKLLSTLRPLPVLFAGTLDIMCCSTDSAHHLLVAPVACIPWRQHNDECPTRMK